MKNTKFLLTIREASQRYSISEKTLYEWSRLGKIPAIRLSARCLRFAVETLDRLFLDHETGPVA